MQIYQVSVRSLVEYACLKGDIDTRYVAASRRQEGIKIHRYIQSAYGEGDMAEVAVKYVYEQDGISLNVQGRIDGVLMRGGAPVIEEIKSTARRTEDIAAPVETHLAQCKTYAYMYACMFPADNIALKVTYCALKSKEIKSFDYTYSFNDLADFFSGLCRQYAAYLGDMETYRMRRDASIGAMTFPFPYRKYQRTVISKIAGVIREGKNIFISAPTGTGKTLNALFPAVASLAEKPQGRVFYATAKSTQKQVAKQAVELMMQNGLQAKTVVITAKEKACFLDKPACNPEECSYAQGYYDKLNDAVKALLNERDLFDYEAIAQAARSRGMCPFELSLDIASACDIIICDYNYIFDPSAALRRFFEDPDADSGYVLLVDEAHNLEDRARSMYSAQLKKGDILALRRMIKDEKTLCKKLSDINKILLGIDRACGGESLILDGIGEDVTGALYAFQNAADKYLQRMPRGAQCGPVSDMYFDINRFLMICDIMNEAHSVYYDKAEKTLNLFCACPRDYLKEKLACMRASVFFSATLSPLSFFCEVLGGGRDDYLMNVPSIFDQNNFKIIVDTSIATSYRKRAQFYCQAAMRIGAAVHGEAGNRMVFFPSYAYMQSVYEQYASLFGEDGVVLQAHDLTEEERSAFISRFTEDSAVTAFVVAGGAFSEAVDLAGRRLIGCVVCGVSLPMVCTRRELIRRYYEKTGKNGFEYAYIFPGMNKVLQAMGRVIRTAGDTGCAVLLDERFAHAPYKKCFPAHYGERLYVCGQDELEEALDACKADRSIF
jgi:DNA excision repair protein ERCC-2